MISRGQLPSETKYTARKMPSLTLMADVIISVFGIDIIGWFYDGAFSNITPCQNSASFIYIYSQERQKAIV